MRYGTEIRRVAYCMVIVATASLFLMFMSQDDAEVDSRTTVESTPSTKPDAEAFTPSGRSSTDTVQRVDVVADSASSLDDVEAAVDSFQDRVTDVVDSITETIESAEFPGTESTEER